MPLHNMNREFLADLIWHGRTGVFICDGGGFIIGANDHFCRLLRYGEVELIGRHFAELLLGKDVSMVLGEFEKIINNIKETFELDVVFVSKLSNPIGVHILVRRAANGELLFGVGQVIEALSPEQVEAMGVLTRSLMEDWLATKGLVVSIKTPKWWESATFWAAMSAIWPIVLGGIWILDLFFRWYNKEV